jgi:hypothetical protein
MGVIEHNEELLGNFKVVSEGANSVYDRSLERPAVQSCSKVKLNAQNGGKTYYNASTTKGQNILSFGNVSPNLLDTIPASSATANGVIKIESVLNLNT